MLDFITYKIFLYKRTSFCPAASVLVVPRTQCFSLSLVFLYIHDIVNKVLPHSNIAFLLAYAVALLSTRSSKVPLSTTCRSQFAVELVEFFDQASSISSVHLVRPLIAFNKRGAVASIRPR